MIGLSLGRWTSEKRLESLKRRVSRTANNLVGGCRMDGKEDSQLLPKDFGLNH